MVDVIIIAVVAVLLAFAAKGSMRHFRGEGGCCGGGKPVRTASRKLDGPVMARRDIRIEGMHCANCGIRVKNVLEAMDGVSAEVDFKSGIAHVALDRSVEDYELRNAVAKAGYKVKEIIVG